MKKQILSLAILIISTFQLKAQTWIIDSVKMDAGTINDVYYSLDNGMVKKENNKNWHLAFSMNTGDSASIWANHNTGNAFVKVYNIHKDKSQWATVTMADTNNATPCFNYDKLWSQGALNDIESPNLFNFGWGTYNPQTHQFVGDSIFIIKADSVVYKIMIDSLETGSMTYYFRLGNLFTNNDVSYSISKSPKYSNALFAHFEMNLGLDTLREPNKLDWDILFTKYNTLATQGQVTMPYNVVGVLGNNLASFAHAENVDVDTAYQNYGTYTNPWSKEISVIGYNWKTFAGGGYVIPDSNSYFIKTTTGSIYQMQFLNYVGASGTFTFRKRLIIPTLINDLSTVTQYSIFPNPTQNDVNIILDSKEKGDAILNLTDFAGRIVYTKNISLKQGLNAFILPTNSIANGQYILSLHGKQFKLSDKILIAK